MALLGIDVITPLTGDWHGAQLPLVERGQFNVGKIQISDSFATAPENVEQLLDVLVPGSNGRKTIILRTQDDLSNPDHPDWGWQQELRHELHSRGYNALVERRTDVDWYLEVGNEPDHTGMGASQISEMLVSAVAIRNEFSPRLSWIASLPTSLQLCQQVISATAGYECLGAHVYGDFHLGDGIYDWPKILDLCLQQDRCVWITEVGINDPDTSDATKAQRVLEYLSGLPPRVVGLLHFAVGQGTSWPQYELTSGAADVYARRNAVVDH